MHTSTIRETGHLSTDRLQRLITVDELAEHLRMSKSALYAWCHRRTIPFYRLGKRSLFDPVEVLEWLETKRVNPVGGAK